MEINIDKRGPGRRRRRREGRERLLAGQSLLPPAGGTGTAATRLLSGKVVFLSRNAEIAALAGCHGCCNKSQGRTEICAMLNEREGEWREGSDA